MEVRVVGNVLGRFGARTGSPAPRSPRHWDGPRAALRATTTLQLALVRFIHEPRYCLIVADFRRESTFERGSGAFGLVLQGRRLAGVRPVQGGAAVSPDAAQVQPGSAL